MKVKKLFFFFLAVALPLNEVIAQSLQRPVIFTTQAERASTLDKIQNYEWAQSIKGQLHDHVDSLVNAHIDNPDVILATIPRFAINDKENNEFQSYELANPHSIALLAASRSGMLYYLTQEEKYAQFTADVLQVYIKEIAQRTPQNTSICGYHFFDGRTTYPQFALAYDFIYNFLTKSGTKVYDRELKDRVIFDNKKAQKSIQNMVSNALQEFGGPDIHGKRVSNHPILTAPGALFMIMCVEDDVVRERLFKVFWETGTAHQNSFTRTILPLYTDQGIWPESVSYSFMPNIVMVLNIVDRIKPELDVAAINKHIFEGAFLFDYLRQPNRDFVRYGDSKRKTDGTPIIYRYSLDIAHRKGYQALREKAEVALGNNYKANGGYKPSMDPVYIFDNYRPLELFWGHEIPKSNIPKVDLNPATVIIEHAGIALQRNYNTNMDPIYGLCGIIGGAHYVHSHCTGITMELYGVGYAIAPNAGLPPSVQERRIPLHEHYFRLYAGNNTVVVNGTSHGLDEGSWKGEANVWQNSVVNIAAEPSHLEDRVAPDFNFATQLLEDNVNNALQQRTLSVIRTSDSTGYYLDLFRSKSLGENKIHDYIYHNLGDKMNISDDFGNTFPLTQTDRYQTDIGDITKSPGWRHFENTQSTEETSKAVNARFDIEYDQKYMHFKVPMGTKRKYTQALAPPTREANNGYVDKKTQVLVIRQDGEAWKEPFMVVLEPSLFEISSVKSVETIKKSQIVVGAKVTSQLGASIITDYIISQDEPKEIKIESLKLEFNGRFAIVREVVKERGSFTSLYIGEGKNLSFGDKVLVAGDNLKGFVTY